MDSPETRLRAALSQVTSLEALRRIRDLVDERYKEISAQQPDPRGRITEVIKRWTALVKELRKNKNQLAPGAPIPLSTVQYLVQNFNKEFRKDERKPIDAKSVMAMEDVGNVLRDNKLCGLQLILYQEPDGFCIIDAYNSRPFKK